MDQDPSSHVITAPPSHGPVMRPTHNGITATVMGTAVLAAWIVFANLVLLIALLTSERRRKVSFNIHAINLAIASLVMGGLVLPLHIDFELKGHWDFSDGVCRLWLISDLMVCTVSCLIVGMMVFDRFVLFSCTSLASGSGIYVFSSIVCILPWVLAASFVIPVYLHGETGSGVDSSNSICYLNLDSKYSIISVIGGYHLPALGAFGILVVMTLTWCVRKSTLSELEWIGELGDKGWQVLMSWVMAVAVLGMWLPFNTLYLIIFLMDVTWPLDSLEAAMWVAYANAGVTPILWMLMPNVRQSVTRLFCCCCRPKVPRRSTIFRTDYSIEDDANISMLEFRYKNKDEFRYKDKAEYHYKEENEYHNMDKDKN